jgi:hypothetical protein
MVRLLPLRLADRADPPATTLDQHAKIQAKLQLQIMDIKAEIHRLKMELKRDQDPTKMGKIQKQIGVRHY